LLQLSFSFRAERRARSWALRKKASRSCRLKSEQKRGNAYFADGVQDEILTDLARIADLKVISRTSVMQYKTGVARNLREIGQQPGVAQIRVSSVLVGG
jgi:TolB-like protein